MSTEIVAALVGVVAGSITSVFTAVFTSMARHRHERVQVSVDRKRQLLERIASELASYLAAPTTLAHVATLYSKGRADEARLTQAIEVLVRGHEHLAIAIYIASLIGEESLSRALSSYWDAADAIYREARRNPGEIVMARLQILIDTLSSESELTRFALRQAFTSA